MPSESHETILSEDRRQDATMRKIFDRVDLLYKHMWIITGILFLMVIIALGIGGYLIRSGLTIMLRGSRNGVDRCADQQLSI